MRRRQLLTAGRRYQASEAGKEAYCRRQGPYRRRQRSASVTHQSQVSITISRPSQAPSLHQCLICGAHFNSGKYS